MNRYSLQFTNDRNVVIEADKFTFPDSRMEFWRGAQLVAVMPLANVLYVLAQDPAKLEAAA